MQHIIIQLISQLHRLIIIIHKHLVLHNNGLIVMHLVHKPFYLSPTCLHTLLLCNCLIMHLCCSDHKSAVQHFNSNTSSNWAAAAK